MPFLDQFQRLVHQKNTALKNLAVSHDRAHRLEQSYAADSVNITSCSIDWTPGDAAELIIEIHVLW